MSRRRTSVADRNRFVDLKLQGQTLHEIAQATGWSFECVRTWWRRYRDDRRRALDPPDKRTQRGGPMSRFPLEVRQAFEQVKHAHPGWGAPVARLRVAEQLAVAVQDLPALSMIEQ